jgi:nucleoporin POM34
MSTPVKSTPVKAAPVTDSPGTWRHPRLDEITRRRNATTFTEKNVKQIAYNAIALLALWALQMVAKHIVSPQSLVFSPRPSALCAGVLFYKGTFDTDLGNLASS